MLTKWGMYWWCWCCVHQGKYFKDEQEYAIMRRRDWLRDRGELERYGVEAARERRKAARLVTPNVLTEILGHSVRFAPRLTDDALRDASNKIYQKEHGRGAARRQSLLPRSYGLGTQVSLGRAKWSLSEHGGASSIFSVQRGIEMASTPAEGAAAARRDMASLRLERLKSQTPFWSILPELTAGRAFLWGSALAVFGSALIAKLACAQLGIRTLDELRDDLPSKMQALLAPSAQSVAGHLAPFREASDIDASGSSSSGGGGELKKSSPSDFRSFTQSLKTWMQASTSVR